jgi:hypothetical protein
MVVGEMVFMVDCGGDVVVRDSNGGGCGWWW